jgi:hypothetical protein
LVEATGIGLGAVKHAIKMLSTAGLVGEVDPPKMTRNLVSFRYGTRLTGWASILDAVRQVAKSTE